MKKPVMAASIVLALSNSAVRAASQDIPEATTTASATTSDSNFQWTLEKMLMATAMPMTGEERNFLQTHKSLDGLRNWTLADFNLYISGDLGKKHVTEEAGHWQGILKMLKQEAAEQSAGLHVPIPAYGEDSEQLDTETVVKMLKQPDDQKRAQKLFELMQLWRKQISILAPYVESMRKRSND